MSTRSLNEGEIVRSRYAIGSDTEITGPAVSVTCLTSARIALSDLFGRVQEKAIDFGKAAGQANCGRKDCHLEVLTPTSDDAMPSEAVFHCAQACGAKCLSAVGLAAESMALVLEGSEARLNTAFTQELNPAD